MPFLRTIATLLVLTGATPVLAQDAPTAERGAQVYAAQKCSLCHAVAGKGNKKLPLDGVGAKLSADDLHKWIVNPKEMEATSATKLPPNQKPMKAYPNLPKADLDSLVLHLQTLK